MRASKPYQPELLKRLRAPRLAAEYLNAALEEDDPKLFLLALRNVAEVHGGLGQLAEKAKLNRESLYRMLSDRGNPEWQSLDMLLQALGFRLTVAVQPRSAKPRQRRSMRSTVASRPLAGARPT
ncbi:MAG: putative addiction module antidote protein [Nitrospirae bacterium]|nr:MAG: putative addiction module antidote protein [Nitrospirota bacterium]